MSDAFSVLVSSAVDDERVAGVILGGSSGKGFATARSDWDVYIVTQNEAEPQEVAASLRTLNGEGRIDLCGVMTLDDFARHALPGEGDEWNRYNFAHVTPPLDRTDGLLQRLCDEKEWLPEELADTRARGLLDAYINSYYRSLKNARDGAHVASRLDAAESIALLWTLVFTAERRARPYNKYLSWELTRHPVDSEWWLVSDPVAAATHVLSTGDLRTQAEIFKGVDRRARALGLGDVLDAWGKWSLIAMARGDGRG